VRTLDIRRWGADAQSCQTGLDLGAHRPEIWLLT
jgi:hypothetical protein